MNFRDYDFVFGEKLSYYIRKTARNLARCVKDNSRELRDFEQDILTELWEARLKWNPSKGASWAEYARVVVKNRAIKIMADANAQKRDHRRTMPMQDVFPEYHETLRQRQGEESKVVNHESNKDPDEGLGTQIAVKNFLSTLPESLRPFAVALQELGMQEAANALGVSVSTVYRRKNEIRERMLKAGLHDLVT